MVHGLAIDCKRGNGVGGVMLTRAEHGSAHVGERGRGGRQGKVDCRCDAEAKQVDIDLTQMDGWSQRRD